MKKQRKAFITVTVSALVTMAVYLILYPAWGAVLSEMENENVRLFIIATVTSIFNAYALTYFNKIRGGLCEKELWNDYSEAEYAFLRDFRVALKNEYKAILLVCAIITACFFLNQLDAVIFGKKTISHITFPFITMTLFATCFKIELIGYITSAVCISAFYVLFVWLYRYRYYKNRIK